MPLHQRVLTHYYPSLSFFSSFQQAKIHGGKMKAASGAIQLLFVLSFTPHATGTRKLTELLFACMCVGVIVFFVHFLLSLTPQVTVLLGSQHWPDAVLLKKRLLPAGGNQALMAACPPPTPCTTAKKSEFLLLSLIWWTRQFLAIFYSICSL